MTLARVVTFEDVTQEQMERMRREMQEGDRPEDVPATEIMVLHDPAGEKATVILCFDSEDDYRRADETLNAMPREETPGRRVSVSKCEMVAHMTPAGARR